MKHTELNKGNLSSFIEDYKSLLDKVKTYTPNTLFEVIDMSLLKEGRCIYCGNKLIVPRGKNVAICRGKRHAEKMPFVVKLSTLQKLSTPHR